MTTWQELEQLKRAVDHIFAEEARRYHLQPIEMHALLALFEHDSQHATALAHAVGRPPTSFTPTLDSLCEKGLTERRTDPSDARATFIHLTPLSDALREPLTAAVAAADSAARDVVAKWQNRRNGDR